MGPVEEIITKFLTFFLEVFEDVFEIEEEINYVEIDGELVEY